MVLHLQLPSHQEELSTRHGKCTTASVEPCVQYFSTLLTHLINGTGQGKVPVLAVHVVRAGARVVTEPDAVILDHAGVLLRQLFCFVVPTKNNMTRASTRKAVSRILHDTTDLLRILTLVRQSHQNLHAIPT